jgi:hypothetical protein
VKPNDDIYAWAIEFPVGSRQEVHAIFVRNDGVHDQAYIEKRAADLHGVIVPLIADRRTENGKAAT